MIVWGQELIKVGWDLVIVTSYKGTALGHPLMLGFDLRLGGGGLVVFVFIAHLLRTCIEHE